MTDRTYRFLDIGLAGLWGVFHDPTQIRVPGLVRKDRENALYVYERHTAPARCIATLKAKTVAELSAKVEDYFTSGTAEPVPVTGPAKPYRRPKPEPKQREIF